MYVLYEDTLSMYGEEPVRKLIGYTDNPTIAGYWRRSSTMYKRRDHDQIKEIKYEVSDQHIEFKV